MNVAPLAIGPTLNLFSNTIREKVIDYITRYKTYKTIRFINLILACGGFNSEKEANRFYEKCASDNKFMNSLNAQIDEVIRTSSPTAILTICSIIGDSINKQDIKFDLSNDQMIMLAALNAIPENELCFFWLLYKAMSSSDYSLIPGLTIDGNWSTNKRPLYMNIQFNSDNFSFSNTGIEKPFTQEGLIAITNDLIVRRIFLVNTSEQIGGGLFHLNFGIGRITDEIYKHTEWAMQALKTLNIDACL
jgi:hypothetical protein